jgi:hypothetical protein
MQTHLPFPCFKESAKVLDYQRLNKQRSENKQILQNLLPELPSNQWENHPAVEMWRGYEKALLYYQKVIIEEWINRGYVNNLDIPEIELKDVDAFPWWLGLDDFHNSHRHSLLIKVESKIIEYSDPNCQRKGRGKWLTRYKKWYALYKRAFGNVFQSRLVWPYGKGRENELQTIYGESK